MEMIVNQALAILDDLELHMADISGRLPAAERSAFLSRVTQVQADLRALVEGGSFTLHRLEEVANELIESVTQYQAIRETIVAEEEISNSQERAARLAVLEEREVRPATRAARVVTDKAERDRTREQHAFLANQMITKLDVIRKAMRT